MFLSVHKYLVLCSEVIMAFVPYFHILTAAEALESAGDED